MKKLLTLLFCLFFLSSPSVYADDISDFEIEGISIGDSLLDYMTEDEILKEIDNSERYYYLNEPNKFAEIYLKQDFSLYDNVSVFISTEPSSKYITNKNEKFIVASVRGIIAYNEEFDSCLIQRDKIIKDLTKMFPNAPKTENTFSHGADPSGDSIVDYVDFELDAGASIYINCQDFEEILRARKKWSDSLNIVTQTKEVSDWFEAG